MIRTFIQRWLGIEEILTKLFHLQLESESHRAAVNDTCALTNRALGRIITKLDPEFGRSDFDPEKRAESDWISKAAIDRIKAEMAAQTPWGLR